MSLKGNLELFPSLQLFHLIHLGRKTGTLSVDGEGSVQLAFSRGRLIYAANGNARRDLSHILWQSGLLSAQQADFIRAHTHGMSEKQIGALLVQAGLLTQAAIAQSARQHALDIAGEVLTWTSGPFCFEGNALPPSDCITVDVGLEYEIVEGPYRINEWSRLRKALPDLDIYLHYEDEPKLKLQDIRLNIREWRVVAASNAQHTIRQIARVNRLTAYQIRHIVDGLLQSGLVKIVQPPQPLPLAI